MLAAYSFLQYQVLICFYFENTQKNLVIFCLVTLNVLGINEAITSEADTLQSSFLSLAI